MTRIRPQLRQLIALSTAHLCAETRDYLSNLPADDWPILGGDTEYGFFIHCPSEVQSLPADLWACLVFAKGLGAEYILFDRDEDTFANLLDFTSQPNESAIGMDDVRIESGARTDAVFLPNDVRILFHKARDVSDVSGVGVEAEMFREAWRKLVGRDDAGALSPSTIKAIERRAATIDEGRAGA